MILQLHYWVYIQKKWKLLIQKDTCLPWSEVKWSELQVAKLCPALWPHALYSLGILQARILEWVAFPFSRGSSQPRDRTQASHIAGRFFTSWATREAELLTKV